MQNAASSFYRMPLLCEKTLPPVSCTSQLANIDGWPDRERTFLQGLRGVMYTPALQAGRKRLATQKEEHQAGRPGMHMSIGPDLPWAAGVMQQAALPGSYSPHAKRVRSLVGLLLT